MIQFLKWPKPVNQYDTTVSVMLIHVNCLKYVKSDVFFVLSLHYKLQRNVVILPYGVHLWIFLNIVVGFK